jgi:uncharacterized protein YuzE
MKVVYDPKQDVLQISFRSSLVEETTQIAPGLILDYDADGAVIGLEIRKASQNVDSPYAIAYQVGEADIGKPQPKVKG